MTPKGTLAIVGCLLMEDEIVHVLTTDPQIHRILIIDNEENSGLLSKLSKVLIDTPITVVDGDCLEEIDDSHGYSVLVWMKDMALHEDPDKLKKDMIETLGKLSGVSQVALLFYGLCGNALKDVVGLSKQAGLPVSILRDSRGEIVDDCIAAVIGGREPYQKIVSKELGVYFLTPMWAETWREMAVKTRVVPPGYDISLLKLVLDTSGYKKVIKIETGLSDPCKFDDRVNEFSEIFELEKEILPGDLTLVENSYEKAKTLMSADS